MNKKKSILESNVLYTIIAIVIGFLVGAIFLTIAGISPAVAYGKLFSSIFSKPKYLVWTPVCDRRPGSMYPGRYIKASGRDSRPGMSGGSSGSRLHLVPDRRRPESKTRHSRGAVLHYV